MSHVAAGDDDKRRKLDEAQAIWGSSAESCLLSARSFAAGYRARSLSMLSMFLVDAVTVLCGGRGLWQIPAQALVLSDGAHLMKPRTFMEKKPRLAMTIA